MNIQNIKDAMEHHQSKVENYIIGRQKYVNTAVLMPLVKVEGEWHFLFQERSPHIRQGGEVGFPGGMHEPEDQTYEETAIRETVEELGVKAEQIQVIGHLGCLVTSTGICVEAFVGILDIHDIRDLQINEDEVAKVFTLPLESFIEESPTEYHVRLEVQPHYVGDDHVKEIYLPSEALGLPKRYHRSWGGSKRKIYVKHSEHGLVWGLTAELVVEFIKLVKGYEVEG